MHPQHQPRWPVGTPVQPDGHGPGGGRYRDTGRVDWATRVAGIVGRITGTDRSAIAGLSDMELDARAAESTRLSSSVPDTRTLHRPGGPASPWSPARQAMHERILARVYDRYKDTPHGRQAIMAGGLPGAGKTSTLRGHHLEQYMPVNPDEMKDEIVAEGGLPDLPEGAHALSPMEMATAFHMESSYLADRLLEMATADGRNILLDATMGNMDAPAARLARLQSAGYGVRGVFVDVPIEVSQRRTASRYRQDMREWAAGRGHGGRPIPAQFIEASRGEPGGPTKNRLVFEQLVAQGAFDLGWEIYDNGGDKPELVDSGR